MKKAKQAINDIKKKHEFEGEIKWSGVNRKTEPMYQELVEYFFRSNLKFRAIVVKKSEIDEKRKDYTFNDFYFRMYYQLLHYPTTDPNSIYNLYFDIKDTCSHLKLRRLREMLMHGSNIRNFQFMRSNESQFIQLADVLTGVVNYNLRVEDGNLSGASESKMK